MVIVGLLFVIQAINGLPAVMIQMILMVNACGKSQKSLLVTNFTGNGYEISTVVLTVVDG